MTIHDMFQAIHRVHPDLDLCERCGHAWHGLPCKSVQCICESAFVERESA